MWACVGLKVNVIMRVGLNEHLIRRLLGKAHSAEDLEYILGSARAVFDNSVERERENRSRMGKWQ